MLVFPAWYTEGHFDGIQDQNLIYLFEPYFDSISPASTKTLASEAFVLNESILLEKNLTRFMVRQNKTQKKKLRAIQVRQEKHKIAMQKRQDEHKLFLFYFLYSEKLSLLEAKRGLCLRCSQDYKSQRGADSQIQVDSKILSLFAPDARPGRSKIDKKRF